ncbi:nitrite reductase (cytochrome c-552) [Desulfofundulus luciae]|uniref:nitrite reductase (cytochrome; ammonia-forming) n=1 Tax=Desulfofundulus luciae TaxID=74702 RepID=A0ABU0B320_9FIRM|nr:ammonia-forming cytochrome c nitrite reductase subunit c552 [Desulfofundulus luciae]MDQ0287111.1 nitrite reductase (cytochrome c-552) [Desulfofundulus luciae]
MKKTWWAWLPVLILLLLAGCAPPRAEMVKTASIPPGEVDPAVWGKVYPLEYDSFMMTKEGGQGESKYKGSEQKDKLSEYPFQLVLLDGWGMGVEFNEPRGHVYMLKDQLDVDPSRRKAGGVCLSCKSPYAPQLKEQMGLAYFQQPYDRVHAMIPQNHAELGLSCIDCHDPANMDLKLSRWFVNDALKALGKDPAGLTRQEKRTMVCAQCHNTYVIPKDQNMKSVGLFLPWQKSQWGHITIEDIESVIKSDPANLEWKNTPTGIKLGHIRHPEFELYSNGSVHWRAGVACADCHMPYERVGSSKISSHHVQSPLKDNMRACTQCHDQSPQWLRDQVIHIQDRVNNMYTRAGNAAAQAAKAIELANKTAGVNQELLNQAKQLYEKAYYRVTFIGAENSMGFHNPEEALRVLGDGLYYADQSLMKAREALVKAGVQVPDKFDLELSKYAKRGTKGVPYRPEQNLEFTFDGTK